MTNQIAQTGSCFHGRLCQFAAGILIGILAWLTSIKGMAADDLRESTSLKFVPNDAAFYTVSLRQREQWEMLTKSRAFAKLMDSPYVKSGWAQAQAMWENPPLPQLQQAKEMLEVPNNRQLLDLIVDACSQEVFAFGDENVLPIFEILNRIRALSRTSKLEAELGGEDRQEIVKKELISILADYVDEIKVPKLVFGMKISDKDRASAQLIRLENLVVPLANVVPQLKGRIQQIAIGDGRFVTLRLDGKQIPWEELLGDDSKLEDEQKDQVRELKVVVEPLEMMLCIGLYGDYLTVAIGESTAVLTELGTGKLLADNDELVPIMKLRDKRITSITFANADFVASSQSGQGQISEWIAMAQRLLEQFTPDQSDVVESLGALAESIQDVETFAQSSVTFLTDQGIEGYHYQWGDTELIDYSQSLSILNHLGGNPLFFMASRLKWGPDDYQALKSLAEFTFEFADDTLTSLLEDDKLETYEKLRDQLTPLGERLATATEDFLMPAIADGQIAMLLEDKSSDKSPHAKLPTAKQPLPLPEFAIVVGIKDAEQFRKAIIEYAAIAQEAIDKIHASYEEVPELKIPEPRSKRVDAGEVFAWLLPEDWGLTREIAPSAGLSKQLAIFSTSPKQVERLMQAAPLSVQGVAKKLDQPMGEIAAMDVSRILQATRPWVDYFVQMYGDQLKEEQGEEANNTIKAIQLQAHAVVDFVSCLKTVSQVAYKEQKTVVTHSVIRFKDAE